MAQDATARTYDADTMLHISRSHITKEDVNPYYGREIPGWDVLGLDPDKQYQMYRPLAEIEKGMDTAARKPILSKHIPITSATIPTVLIVGSIGSDLSINAPYLDADLCFWTDAAIAGIETETVRELSCAYRYVPVMTPGNFAGKPYDGIITEIQFNHLAQVEAGRAGSDVMAADSKPEIPTMKMTKFGKALFVSLGQLSPKLAQDSKFPALVGTQTKKTFKKADVRAGLLAMDADIASEPMDNILDALSDVESNPEAMTADAEPTDKRGKLTKKLSGKVNDDELAEILGIACDGDEPEEKPGEKPAPKINKDGEPKSKEEMAKDAEEAEKKTDKKVEAAMDSFKREQRDANDARIAVQPVVGNVLAMDSAEEIYAFALDEMGVDHKDVKGVPALKALFSLANKDEKPAGTMALDSASVVKQFPNAGRFRQA